jgi:hypothetical protein
MPQFDFMNEDSPFEAQTQPLEVMEVQPSIPSEITYNNPTVIQLANEAKAFVVEACTVLGWVLLLNSTTTPVEKRHDIVVFTMKKAIARSTANQQQIADILHLIQQQESIDDVPLFVKDVYREHVRILFTFIILSPYLFLFLSIALRYYQRKITRDSTLCFSQHSKVIFASTIPNL